MPAYFPSSFVRSTPTESVSAPAETAMGVTLPPWLRPHQLQDYDPLPRSLYPVLPPPAPYMQVQPIPISRSPTNSGTGYDTVMTDAESEDLDGVPLGETDPSFDNFTFQRDTTPNYLDSREGFVSELQPDEDDSETAEETVPVAKPARTHSTRGKKKALKAVEAINKSSRKRSIKNAKNQNQAPANGNQNRRTGSSTRSQPAAPQPAITESGDEIAQPTKKNKIRKTWLPWERKLLRRALVSWWTSEGAARFNHPTKMVLPNKKDGKAWDWITAECKALNGSFNRVPGGAYIVARNMQDDLPPVSVPGDSTAGRRRRK